MPTPTAPPDPLRRDGPRRRASAALAAAVLAVLASACDGGLAPPDVPPTGAIRATVTYTGAWPPSDALHDLRFVAMRFIPRDTSDFLDLSRIVFSPRGLSRHVERDTVVIGEVAPGPYLYSGIAQQYSQSLFAWRPVGLYEDGGGVFHVQPGETTDVAIAVDFDDLPPFPPE